MTGRQVVPKLVGREHELRVLRTALRTAPALILVVGEAGVGKSRLVSELRKTVDSPARWLAGRCLPIRDPAPLAPLAEAFRGIDGLSIAFGDTGRFLAWTGLMDGLASLGPTVLVIEDLQWADRATLQVLRYLASRLPRDLQLIATYRGEETQQSGEITALAGCVPAGTRTTELRLRPLGLAAVAELAAELRGDESLPAASVAELLDQTSGLPFVIEELLRDVPVGETRVPLALRASMTIRLGQVPEACRRVVYAASVLNSPAPDSLLGSVAEVSGLTLAEAVDVAVARGLLWQKRPGLYDHRHVLARRAVYESIPADDLRRLHRRAASALAAIEPPAHARIAEHARLGGLIGDWMVHSEAAADQLLVAHDNDAAFVQLTELLNVEALPWADRARLAVKLGSAVSADRPWRDAVVIMSSLLAESIVPSPRRGRLRLALGLLLHERAGEVLAGRRELKAAIEELGSDPDAAWAMSALAVPVFGEEPVAAQEGWMDDALRVAAERGLRPEVRVNHVRFQLATGCVEGVEEVGAEAADGLAWLGHDRRSTALLERAAAGWDSFEPVRGAGTRLRIAFGAGEWGGLAERLARARKDAVGMPLVRTEIDLVDGLYRLALGDVAEGKRSLESVLSATVGGPLTVRAAALAALARSGHAGLCSLKEGVELVRRKDGWAWAGELVIAACGALETAGELANEFAAGLRGKDAPSARAALMMVRAGLGGSAELFGRAAAEYEVLGRKYDQYGALEGRGLCLLASGRPEELAAMAAAYETLGAHGDARRCREALREAGVPVSPRRGRRGYGNALSPRELEVARLAARGLSNSSIATALTLSVSTVEDHLSRAMRKLDVRSRHALAPLITR